MYKSNDGQAALLQVMMEEPSFSPRTPPDNFHFIEWHAAAVNRLHAAGGYQLFWCFNRRPRDCPSWIASGSLSHGPSGFMGIDSAS